MGPLNIKNRISGKIFLLSLTVFVVLALAVAATILVTNTKHLPLTAREPNKIFTVIIDAGHGGRDEGTKTKTAKEKDITLAIAKQIEKLAPQYGLKVILTRRTDTFMNPIHRVAFAMQQNADAYVSIHVNELRGYSYVSGMQVYVSNKNPDFEKSRQLGSAISQNLGADFKISHTLQPRAENIFVLADNFMPSVLIECGFITNANDLKLLTDSAKTLILAKQVLTGISAYANHAAINEYAVQIVPSPSIHRKTILVSSTPMHTKKLHKKNSKTA
jgi:N-acetylmuramoyl-L-alanine amidase